MKPGVTRRWYGGRSSARTVDTARSDDGLRATSVTAALGGSKLSEGDFNVLLTEKSAESELTSPRLHSLRRLHSEQ